MPQWVERGTLSYCDFSGPKEAEEAQSCSISGYDRIVVSRFWSHICVDLCQDCRRNWHPDSGFGCSLLCICALDPRLDESQAGGVTRMLSVLVVPALSACVEFG